jgi:tetratricopeptide (TPR) repeat protein
MFKQIEATIPAENKGLFYYYYAQSAFGIGQFEEYLRLLGEAIKLDKKAYAPTLVDAYAKVADQYNSAGDLDKYIYYLEKAVEQSPQTAALHLKLSYAYEEAAKFDKAVAQWRMVLDLEADHPRRLDLLNLIVKYTKAPTTAPTTRPAGGGKGTT